MLTDDLSNYRSTNEWSEYLGILEGQSRAVVESYVSQIYRGAYSRGSMQVRHWPLIPYILKKACPAMSRPLRISRASAKCETLWVKWRPILQRARNLAYLADSAYLHVGIRSGLFGPELSIDPLGGGSLTPTYGNQFGWEGMTGLDVKVSNAETIRYTRGDSGWTGVVLHSGIEKVDKLATNAFKILPVFPVYREFYTRAVPEPDSMLLDLHVDLGLKLTDADYRRRFKQDQPYHKTDTALPDGQLSGSEEDIGPDLMKVIDSHDELGILESHWSAMDDMVFVREYITLACVFLGLPPELFQVKSRAETGAAKEVDFEALYDLAVEDMVWTDMMLAEFSGFMAPLCEQMGFGSCGLAQTAPPKKQLPKDLTNHAAGLKAMAAIKMISLVHEYCSYRGISPEQAVKEMEKNKEEYRKWIGSSEVK